MGHANVVYAVDAEVDYTGYMDPWPGMAIGEEHGDYLDMASEFLIGWPSKY